MSEDLMKRLESLLDRAERVIARVEKRADENDADDARWHDAMDEYEQLLKRWDDESKGIL